jgi:hypothetical protein
MSGKGIFDGGPDGGIYEPSEGDPMQGSYESIEQPAESPKQDDLRAAVVELVEIVSLMSDGDPGGAAVGERLAALRRRLRMPPDGGCFPFRADSGGAPLCGAPDDDIAKMVVAYGAPHEE